MSESNDNNEVTPKHEEKGMVEFIDKVDPNKIEAIAKAIVTPFQSGPAKERRFILILILGVLAAIIVAIFVLAALGKVDGGIAIFALGTAFGYIFGFLSKLFVS
jgi:hypothetical protein